MTNSKLFTKLSLFLLLFIDAMGFGLIFPVLTPILLSPHDSILATATPMALRQLYFNAAFGIFSLFVLIGTPILGDLSDQYGRRKILLICLMGTAFGILLCATAIEIKSIALLLIGRAISGFLAGSQSIAQAAISDISTYEEKTKNLSLMGFAGSIGFIIGPLIGGYFSDTQNFHWVTYSTPFYIGAGLALLNALMLFLSFQETYVPKVNKKIELIRFIDIFKTAFLNKQIRILSFAMLCAEGTWAVYFQYVNSYLVKVYNYSSATLSHFIAVMSIVFAFTFTVIIRLGLRFFKEKMLSIISFIFYGICVLLLAYYPSELMQWWLMIPITISSGIFFPCLLGLYSQSVDADHQGWVMGIANAVIAVSWILGSTLTSILAVGGSLLPFFGAGILGLLGIIPLLY